MTIDFVSALIGGIVVIIGIFLALCLASWGAQGPDCINGRLEAA